MAGPSSAASSAAKKALKGMNKTQKPKVGNPDDYYVKILIYQGRRFAYGVVLGSIVAAMTVVLFLNMHSNGHWFNIVVPVVGLGLLTLIYPTVEEWSYRPWQATAQQVERHSYDV